MAAAGLFFSWSFVVRSSRESVEDYQKRVAENYDYRFGSDRPFDDDGVSCIACHSIESVNLRGVGGYTIGQPALLQKPDGTKTINATNQDILNNVADHKRAMMRDLLKTPEFCAACHKSQVPH